MNYNLILHLDSGEPEMFRLAARNAANYLNALPEQKFELDIVANGGGASLLTLKHADLHEIGKNLMARGVVIKVCANALAEKQIPHADVWPGCQIVPAGLVEIARLQQAGFAYVKP